MYQFSIFFSLFHFLFATIFILLSPSPNSLFQKDASTIQA